MKTIHCHKGKAEGKAVEILIIFSSVNGRDHVDEESCHPCTYAEDDTASTGQGLPMIDWLHYG